MSCVSNCFETNNVYVVVRVPHVVSMSYLVIAHARLAKCHYSLYIMPETHQVCHTKD